MARYDVLRAAVIAIAFGLAGALALPQSAWAAGELEVSDDGVTYGASLGGPLFASIPVLVPGQSASSVFYVRNASADPAYLRITLDSASASSGSLAAALKLAASVPGLTGSRIAIGSTSGCRVLLDGPLIQPGASVAVTIGVSLSDVGGTVAQNATATINLGVTLTQAVGQSRSGCGTPNVVVPVVPGPPADATAEPTPSPSPTPAPVDEPDDPLESFPAFFNTVASDGSLVLYSSLAVGVGAAAYFFLPVIRRRRFDEVAEGDPS